MKLIESRGKTKTAMELTTNKIKKEIKGVLKSLDKITISLLMP
jgi:hypothetical protein